MKAEKENQKIPENQICMENCKDKATTDYNGCGHFVCDFHNGRLIDYLNEEIPIKMDAEQALLNIFSENTLVGQIKVINDYARIQIEKDREGIKANINFNDDGIKQAIEKVIDNTPINLD